jgi:thiol-disulfide isomerase/thioredoxin
MGSRAALVAGIVLGSAIVLLLGGAIVLSMASGSAETVTLPPATGSTGTPAASAQPTLSPSMPASSPSIAPTPAPSGSPAATDVTDGLFGVGKPAPPLRVDLLDGGTVDLAQLRGRPVWVAFTASWCPPCRDEYATMESFAFRYASTGLEVVTVHEKDDPAAVRALIDELGITFPVALDPDGSAGRDWRAIALPIHFWVDADGIVRDGALGGVGPAAMAAGLQTILPGIEVTPFAPTPTPAASEPAGSPGASLPPVVEPTASPTPAP